MTNVPSSKDPPTSPIAIRLRCLQEDYTRLRSVHTSTLNELKETKEALRRAEEALTKKESRLEHTSRVLLTMEHEMANEVERREYFEKRYRNELQSRRIVKKSVRENTVREVFERLSERFGKASQSQEAMVEMIGEMEELDEILDKSDSSYMDL